MFYEVNHNILMCSFDVAKILSWHRSVDFENALSPKFNTKRYDCLRAGLGSSSIILNLHLGIATSLSLSNVSLSFNSLMPGVLFL